MTPRHDLRLLPAALCAWLCAAALVLGLERFALLACGVLMLAVVAAWGSRSGAAAMLLLPLAASASVLLIGHASLESEEGLEELALAGGGTVTATLAADPREREPDVFTGEPQVMLTLSVHEAAAPGQPTRSVGGEAIVIAPASWGGALSLGERVTLEATWTPAGSGRAVVLGFDPTLLERSPPSGALAVVAHTRAAFRDATEGLSDQTRGLVRGMVIGDRSEMPEEQADDMKTVGLTHLTAVSGTHLSIVAGLLALALRSLRLRRGARVLGLATGMIAFAALVLPQPSVLRALAMALVGGLGALWGRPAQAMPALFTAIIVLVAIDPHLALEPGMMLSASAVVGIVLLAPAIRRRLTPMLGGMAATGISIPLAAQVACAPILVILAPSVSLWTVPANIAAVPFAAPVVGLGAVTVLSTALGLPGASALVAVLGLAAAPIARIAHALAGLPGATLALPEGVWGVLLALAVLAGTAGAVSALPSALRLASVGLALVALVVGIRAGSPASSTPIPEGWRIASCDVGQGDMTVVRASLHSAVVIDTGPGGGAAECLAALRVTHIPLLILSHPHADHDGAIAELAQVATIDEAWWSAASEGEAGSRASVALVRLGISAEVPATGDRASVGDAVITVLPTPGTRGHGAATAGDESAVNDQSLALVVESGGVSALLLGDLEERAQEALASAMGELRVDAVKVAHHGSSSQSADLAAHIDAAVALVSVGAGNTYGHPTARALALYSDPGTAIVRTDECGTIALYRDGGLGVASRCPTPMAG
ncbi:ComEC/Rec2 family competence protein [Demequina zhanjiangensis]|uniref:ComEC/Rec2 family competence protein n=1 Tax=Demequina zhanjiangensis TaxID=3051659 RepID=A0ABT8G025_9MICO|nr:ComEC/Rec2 family competence protein [Demequina sp. SYSU T00b26]MDN4472483.1 ComEC/Rec2 family competence protein [Demequina sp. SYSU T00b26]